MIIKKISNNPIINADRWASVEANLTPTSIVLSINTDYRDSNGIVIQELPKKHYKFSTDGNMVDSTTWQPAQLIDILDEEENVIWRDRPATAVSEFMFFTNFPANAFSDTELRERVKKLVEARLNSLDLQGKFN